MCAVEASRRVTRTAIGLYERIFANRNRILSIPRSELVSNWLPGGKQRSGNPAERLRRDLRARECDYEQRAALLHCSVHTNRSIHFCSQSYLSTIELQTSVKSLKFTPAVTTPAVHGANGVGPRVPRRPENTSVLGPGMLG
jgi:hypothetical protein